MSTTRKILTKAQVDALMKDYTTVQTAAAKQAEAAYNREADVSYQNQKKTWEDTAAKAQSTAEAAYDTQYLKALIAKRRLAEQLASRGLSQSGLAAAGKRSAKHAVQLAAATRDTAKKAALAALKQKSEALLSETEAKKQKNTASSQKTLNNRLAEKRLSLSRLMY